MVTFGTFWIICKIAISVIIWGFIIYYSPAILMGIILLPFALIAMPFIIGFFLFRHWYQNKVYEKMREENEQFERQEYTEEIEESEIEDLYSLVGVSSTSSKEEIKAAYKHKMMLNHPDKLATLDPELQRIASERTVAIQYAYEKISGMHVKYE